MPPFRKFKGERELDEEDSSMSLEQRRRQFKQSSVVSNKLYVEALKTLCFAK